MSDWEHSESSFTSRVRDDYSRSEITRSNGEKHESVYLESTHVMRSPVEEWWLKLL